MTKDLVADQLPDLALECMKDAWLPAASISRPRHSASRGRDSLDAAGSLRHHDDPVAEVDSFLDAVGDEEHRVVQLALQPRHLLLQDGTGLRIKGAERLVHEQDLGPDDQSTSDRDALLNAPESSCG